MLQINVQRGRPEGKSQTLCLRDGIAKLQRQSALVQQTRTSRCITSEALCSLKRRAIYLVEDVQPLELGQIKKKVLLRVIKETSGCVTRALSPIGRLTEMIVLPSCHYHWL